MSYRPYFKTSIGELELVFKGSKDSETLANLKEELGFRSTQRALNLLRQVQDAIRMSEQKASGKERLPSIGASNSPRQPGRYGSIESGSVTSDGKFEAFSRGTPVRPDPAKDPLASHMLEPNSIPHKRERPAPEGESRQMPSEKAPTENHSRLVDLLTYLEHLAKLGEKPVFALRDYQQLAKDLFGIEAFSPKRSRSLVCKSSRTPVLSE